MANIKSSSQSKLLLIDGNAILHRAYHALPPMTSKASEPVNAVYGFVSMLLRMIELLKPTHISAAWDTAKPTFRHTEYADYQSHRPRLESDLSPQFGITQEVLETMKVPVFFCEGFEADDVIGTIVQQCIDSSCVHQIVIVTGDRDILQLVNDEANIKVFMPIKGLSEGKLYGEAEALERMGVKASQIIDFKALVGDPSDNYPGVNGIGPKTAIELLTKYETLENIYENLWQIPDKFAKKLALGAEPAGISKRLATIVRDVPISFDIKKAEKWDIDSKEALNLFQQIGFKTLTERVRKLGESLQQEKELQF